MRVLLIAYEYPPIESAQALRWHYLGRELVAAGFELTVLAPRLVPANGDQLDPASVIRSWPGPFVGLSGWLARRGRVPVSAAATPVGEGLTAAGYRLIRAGLDQIVFPDVRTEWYPFARRAARRLRAGSFETVVASHEPGVDLLLGMHLARRMQRPLIVDLGDPLVTPYSPRWRRRLDRGLERRVCESASGIITTTARLGAELVRRHRLEADKLIVIEQGFDASGGAAEDPAVPLPEDRFWLFFSGNFYRRFRNPRNFLEALAATPPACLVYAGHTPRWLLDLIEPLADRVICLGRLPHEQVLTIQRRAPMLLSVGNRSPNQLPGKLYEYLGAGRPILHLTGPDDDEVREILEPAGRGISLVDDRDRIAAVIAKFARSWRRGTFDDRWRLDPAAVAHHSWQALGARLAAFLRDRAGR